jgi:hypothetical protein
MKITAITVSAAKRFVAEHHRHLPKIQGGLFAVAVEEGGAVRGVAIAGLPCRMLQDGTTLQVSRVATDGIKNGCSMLYGAIRRASAALGWKRLFTYTLINEPGTSLRAVGFLEDGMTSGGQFDCQSRRRRLRLDWEAAPKRRWRIDL